MMIHSSDSYTIIEEEENGQTILDRLIGTIWLIAFIVDYIIFCNAHLIRCGVLYPKYSILRYS